MLIMFDLFLLCILAQKCPFQHRRVHVYWHDIIKHSSEAPLYYVTSKIFIYALRTISCLEYSLVNRVRRITFEVKLPSACSFIVDGLAFCCRCSHYMFRPTWPSSSVYDILLFIPEGICFAVFVAFVACCYIMQFLIRVCFCCVSVNFHILVCKTIYNKAARRRQHNLKSYWTIQCSRMLKYNIMSS
jgi:hypothetical protein